MNHKKEELKEEIHKYFFKNNRIINVGGGFDKFLKLIDANPKYFHFKKSAELFKELKIYDLNKIEKVVEFVALSLTPKEDLECIIPNCKNLKHIEKFDKDKRTFKTKLTCKNHIIDSKNVPDLTEEIIRHYSESFSDGNPGTSKTFDELRNYFYDNLMTDKGSVKNIQKLYYIDLLTDIIKFLNLANSKEEYLIYSMGDQENTPLNLRYIKYLFENNIDTFEKFNDELMCPLCNKDIKKIRLTKSDEKIKLSSLCNNCLKTPKGKEYCERMKQENAIKGHMKKHGVQRPFMRKEVQEKVNESHLKKYGVSRNLISEEFLKNKKEYQKKAEETNLKKYGVRWYAQTEEYKEKYLKNLPEIKEKMFKTNIERYGARWYTQHHLENLDKLNKCFIKEKFIDKEKYFKCNDFCNFFNCESSTAYRYLKLFNIKYISNFVKSSQEYQIIKYLQEDLSVDKDKIIHSDRKTIAPFELDIFIPEKNLAIEYNGVYWHSFSLINNISKNQSDLNFQRTRHLNKTIACENKGINLLHIFENEFLDPKKQDIWKSVIGYKLGITKEKYYARKLKVQKISSKEAKAFFEENHLQGGQAPGSIAYGLFKDNELISCMTFGKSRFNKRYDYELIRFASKKYTSCVGCAKRLFKAFVKEYNPKSIISYANRRWASSLSNLYKAIGFKELEPANPNYFYFKINQKEIILKSRNVFQKHKLKDHPDTKGFYDKNKTESQIMAEAGFRRIYDAGNLVYLWEQS